MEVGASAALHGRTGRWRRRGVAWLVTDMRAYCFVARRWPGGQAVKRPPRSKPDARCAVRGQDGGAQTSDGGLAREDDSTVDAAQEVAHAQHSVERGRRAWHDLADEGRAARRVEDEAELAVRELEGGVHALGGTTNAAEESILVLVAVPTEREGLVDAPFQEELLNGVAQLVGRLDVRCARDASTTEPGLLRRARVELRRLRVDLGEEVTGPAVKLLRGGATSPVLLAVYCDGLRRWRRYATWRRRHVLEGWVAEGRILEGRMRATRPPVKTPSLRRGRISRGRYH